jgi:hypothetical protein
MDEHIRKLLEQQENFRRLAEGPLRYLRDQQEAYTRAFAHLGLGYPTAAERLAQSHAELSAIVSKLDLSSEVLEKFSARGSILEMQRVYQEQQTALKRVADRARTLVFPERDFAAEIASASSYITLANTAYSTVDWSHIEQLVEADRAKYEGILRITDELTSRHADLIASLSIPEGRLATVPSFVTEFPAADLFAHGLAVRSVTPHRKYRDPEEEQQIEGKRVDLANTTHAFLETALEELKPAFLHQWRGAKARAQDRGPDWCTQSGASMRKLLKGVLHRVASDDIVLPWALKHGKPLDDNGHPTRATKVEWLCQFIPEPEYRRLVDTQIRAALKVIAMLNASQHEDDVAEVEEQFDEIMLRAEVAITHILTIYKDRQKH